MSNSELMETSEKTSAVSDVALADEIENGKAPTGEKLNFSSALPSNVDKNKDQQQDNNNQPLFEQPIIVEGKRSRKATSRLELIDLSPPRKEFSIPQGRGKPLGEIPFLHYQISNGPNDVLSRLRTFCVGRRTSKIDIRKNLFEFKGFEFTRDSDEYQRHLATLIKMRKDHLKSLIDFLGLSSNGSQVEQAERILQFLVEPFDEGKAIPEPEPEPPAEIKQSTARPSRKRVENGAYNEDDYDDFEMDDDEMDETVESDDDYIGSDEDTSQTLNDDPDDFVYQPGKKAPKRKPSLKRSRTSTSSKRKRAASTRVKRPARTRSKSNVGQKKLNKDLVNPIETKSIDSNNEQQNSSIDQGKAAVEPAVIGDQTATTNEIDVNESKTENQ